MENTEFGPSLKKKNKKKNMMYLKVEHKGNFSFF